MLEESLKLNNFEYKFADIDGGIEYIGRDNITGPYNEVNKYFYSELDTIPIKLLDGSKFNILSISFGCSDKIKYTTEKLNTIYKRNYNYQDISSFNILAHRDLSEKSAMLNNKSHSTQINVTKIAYSSKETQRHVYDFYTNGFGSDTFEYSKYKLHFKYNKEEKACEINCISKNSDDQCVYIYNIKDYTIDDFDQGKIINLIEEYDIFATLEGIEMFMNKPGATSYTNGE